MVAVVIAYWKRLIEPHRINSVVFAALAPWDVRLTALFGMAAAVLLESALSFLGLGTPLPAPSWGSMLSVGRGYLALAPWYGIFPGIAITLLVMAEVEVLADDHHTGLQAAHEHPVDERLRALRCLVLVERHDHDRVDAGRLQQLELLLGTGQQPRRRLGPHDARRMTIEGHHHRLRTEIIGHDKYDIGRRCRF